MKPNWENSPEWANYLTLNYSGGWVWHEEEPVSSNFGLDWYSQGAIQFAGKEDFQGICEKRP